MSYVANLHTHSRYARATGSTLTLDNLAAWAKIKGIDLLSSADFTHPRWRAETRDVLRPADGDLYEHNGVRFVLGTEVSCSYRDSSGGHQVHMLLYAPNFATVDRLSDALAKHGQLAGDGRPILHLSADDLVELARGINERCMLIPAHVWTPWFSVYGSRSGYDSIREAFPKHWDDIRAIETGLSSDPAMNWRIPELDDRTIVSFGDAHSLARLGREATVFAGDLTYDGLRTALREDRVALTIEFYPEEGRYHFTGHRACGLRYSPEETRERGTICPVCKRQLTVGVLDRVEHLARRPDVSYRDADGLFRNRERPDRPPYRLMVPLQEILSEAVGAGVGSKRVKAAYDTLIERFDNELNVLLNAPVPDLTAVAGERVAEGIDRVRRGDIQLDPGYDGVYGTVHIWSRDTGASPSQGRLR